MTGASQKATGASRSEQEMNPPPPMDLTTVLAASASEVTLPPSSPPPGQVPQMPHEYIRLFKATGFGPDIPSPVDIDNLPPGAIIIDHCSETNIPKRKRSKRPVDPPTPSNPHLNRRAAVREFTSPGHTALLKSHILEVNPGEDVASKIMELSYSAPHTICILNCNGVVGVAELSFAAAPGGIIKHEGRFDIVSLSGIFAPTQGSLSRSTGSLAITLCGTQQETVFGGIVSGVLVAATMVQVVIGSFFADHRGESSGVPNREELS